MNGLKFYHSQNSRLYNVIQNKTKNDYSLTKATKIDYWQGYFKYLNTCHCQETQVFPSKINRNIKEEN